MGIGLMSCLTVGAIDDEKNEAFSKGFKRGIKVGIQAEQMNADDGRERLAELECVVKSLENELSDTHSALYGACADLVSLQYPKLDDVDEVVKKYMDKVE